MIVKFVFNFKVFCRNSVLLKNICKNFIRVNEIGSEKNSLLIEKFEMSLKVKGFFRENN